MDSSNGLVIPNVLLLNLRILHITIPTYIQDRFKRIKCDDDYRISEAQWSQLSLHEASSLQKVEILTLLFYSFQYFSIADNRRKNKIYIHTL